MKNKYLLAVLFSAFLGFQSWAQCYDQLHTPFEEDGWLSCLTAVNPNPDRGDSHWILYDLGWEYTLDSTYIWNWNAWGSSAYGVKELAIDYSLNGTDWTTLGTFEIEEAKASVKYDGAPGPSFDQVPARYVLLTALSSWGDNNCVGLSEIRFNVSQTTSIDPELAIDRSMEVSPNPVIDQVQISIKAPEVPDRLALFDLSGKMIVDYQGLQSKNVTLDMSHLAGGIYLAKAWFDQTLLTKKIVKVGGDGR